MDWREQLFVLVEAIFQLDLKNKDEGLTPGETKQYKALKLEKMRHWTLATDRDLAEVLVPKPGVVIPEHWTPEHLRKTREMNFKNLPPASTRPV